jgi:NADH:ubiquinone oxidoreductase subunit F (NADH-binding)/(2Fe-2S) ferredoxin
MNLEHLHTAGQARLFSDRVRITVGLATCGLAAGADAIYGALKQRLEQRRLDVLLTKTGCLGACHQEPIVEVRLPGSAPLLYTKMTRARARALVDELARGAPPASPWAVITHDESPFIDPRVELRKPSGFETAPVFSEQPFMTWQRKIVLRNCGLIDPASLEEYIARGGYQGLQRTLREFTPQQVVDEVSRSGLRGRGGGGFLTGRKWQIAREAVMEKNRQGDADLTDTPAAAAASPGRCYLICNGDEGDPGAYMDRTVLESDPHSVVEGMILGAYAVGAHQGYAYIRDEYPLAVERMTLAVKQAEEHGLLGRNILGSGFDFSVQIVRGAGAFVCGEETALIASIEGGIGEPRPKPPYPAVSGLWGQPTIINNVKTWATIPVIMARGATWYASLGTPHNAGTVVFSLVGQISNTGLVEVPLGLKLRDLIDGIGGGGIEGRSIKAVQTGGPSGGCLPARLFDLPIEYEALKEAGSIMGSGGLVVLDESSCMVDVARYFLDFTTVEACGKCTACREGNRHLKIILDRITRGQGAPDDLALLAEVGEAVQAGSLCGLGQTAPNPVLSTLRYFRAEYEAHVIEKRCPAGKCEMSGR